MIGLLTVGFLIIQINSQLPDPQSIRNIELKVPLRVYSADKLLISEFGNERRKPIEFVDFPQSIIDAVLASEDDGFFEHGGIDFSGLIRAALSNFRSGHTEQGASTITMQVARNFFLSPEKTYLRKVREILLAIKLEQILSKQEILSLYLNKIFLGHRSYGFGAAAEVYYGKELAELSIAEIAMLAGLPKAPSRYNPLRNVERALLRRNYVLKRMLDLDKITDSSYQHASTAPATAEKHERPTGLVAPHIAEMVRSHLTEAFGEDAYWQGLNVYTTIQSKQQLAADTALRDGLKAYDKRHGFRGPIARLKLDELEKDPELGGIDYDLALSIYPNSQEQRPAIITKVSDQHATAQTRGFGAVVLELQTTKWAKRYRTANIVGGPVQKMTQVLSVGDVVYIEPFNNYVNSKQSDAPSTPDTTEPSETPQWKLSQIPNIGGALISIEPQTGRVISLVGGYDFFLNKYNRAVQSIRQPGSNIKPFIYSASLDKGFSPATMISGAPIVTRDPVHGTLWRPENYSGKFFGPTRMREALSKSLNLVSIRLLRSIGIPFAREYTKRFGFEMNRFSPSLTMALGAGGATPMQVINAYSTLANGGYQVKPQFIDYILDRNGQVIYRSKRPDFCDECYTQYLPKLDELEASTIGPDGELIVDEAPLTDQEPSADREPLANQEPSANREPSANQKSLASKEPPVTETSNTELDKTKTNAIGSDAELTQDTPLSEAETLAAALLNADSQKNQTYTVDQEYYTAPRVMNSANNFLTVSMLKDVVRLGTARKALQLNRQDLAGKTGTTNDYIDAWFSGFNSQVATTVWVGFDNPATMGRGEAGSRAALPIWIDYMQTGLDGVPQDAEEIPPYIEQTFINRVTGKRTHELDPQAMPEFMTIADAIPELNTPEANAILMAQHAEKIALQEQEIERFNAMSPEQQDLQRKLDAEKLLREQESLENNELPTRSNLELLDDGELNPQQPINPQERIIEQEQDTQDLF